MKSRTKALLLGVSIFALPVPAFAQSTKELDLERRVTQLEQLMAQMQGQVEAANGRAAAAESRLAVTEAKVAAASVKTTPPLQPDGFKIGTGSTTVKVGGFIKTVASFSHWSDGEVAANALGRDFYLPQQIPIGPGPSSNNNDMSAKQTRLSFSFDTPLGGHSLKGYLEGDFQTAAGTQGTQRTTNGYNFALRRAYVQFDKLTVGQDWTTFQYTGALPESTDFVGATEGTVFVRQPVIRYSMPLSKIATLHVALENAETASASAGSPALVENADDRTPDLAARVQVNPKFGELSLGVLARKLTVANAGIKANSTGWGVSGAGKLFLNQAKSADVRFMLTYGEGIGRYVGLNFAPDAIYNAVPNDLDNIRVFAGLAAIRLPLGSNIRANVMGSFQNVDYPGGYAATAFNSFSKSSWSVAGNIFYSPIKPLDLGIELRHANRKLIDGRDGTLDRLELAAKYNF